MLSPTYTPLLFLQFFLHIAAAPSPFALHDLGKAHSKKRCTAYDACWPDQETWDQFNDTVAGRLIASRPSAASCHDRTYDSSQCNEASLNWTDSAWRTSQVGAYSAILWEVGNGQCFPDTSRQQLCDQGLVAYLTVNTSRMEDIHASIRFAHTNNIYLTIKNTGHDHLGRSSGSGSFAIWTHNLKGTAWHDSFVPENAPESSLGIPAVTLQAGEQWLDVYRDATANGRIIVGGSARTVGAAGGYLLGGGHSPWSYHYGLAADNLLEMMIVTPTGEHVTLNEYTDPDYFWAVRGGGGSAWGVVTSVTYKTHPIPSHVQVAFVQVNTTSTETWRNAYAASLRALPAMTDAGYTGYWSTTVGELVQFIFLQPNGTDSDLERGLKGFDELTQMNGTAGMSIGVGNFMLSSWEAYTDLFLTDPNIATNIQDASRLLTPEVLSEKADALVDLALRYPDAAPGHNFSEYHFGLSILHHGSVYGSNTNRNNPVGKVNPTQRSKTSVHPIWASARTIMSYGIDWPNNATEAEKKKRKQMLVEISLELEKIVGLDGGTYVNEANPYEPRWKEAFWGSNYDRLERIKRRIDPRNLMVCNRCVGSDLVYEP